jgi:hypothetical protein
MTLPTDRALTPAELHEWLNRKPPPGSWRDFEVDEPEPEDLDLRVKAAMLEDNPMEST